jgi:serine/threonine-protein kinase ULK/ATG1
MLYGVAPFLPPKGGNINDLINVIATSELKFPDSPPVSDSLKKLLMSML